MSSISLHHHYQLSSLLTHLQPKAAATLSTFEPIEIRSVREKEEREIEINRPMASLVTSVSQEEVLLTSYCYLPPLRLVIRSSWRHFNSLIPS